MSSGNDFMCYGKVAAGGAALKWEESWITIHGKWLEVTKKIGQPGSYILPLHLASITAAFQETGFQNSILITTSAVTGSIKIYFHTTNRYDIILLHQALTDGHKLLNESLEHHKISRECEIRVESLGFLKLIATKLVLKETPEGFTISGNKGVQRFDFDRVQCVHAKANDANATTRLCITADESGAVTTKEYNCIDRDSLMRVILCFIMNSHIWNKQNRNSTTPAQPGDVSSVGIPEMSEIPDLIQMD